MPNRIKYRRIFWHLIWLILLALGWVVINPASAGAISLSAELPRQKVIVIDPGHGGHDLGAVGPSGLPEKAVTLSVAKKIKENLSGAYEVHLTRDDDYSVDIERRTAVANHYQADVFVSLHAGGGFGHQGRGMIIFYHRPPTSPISAQGETWETGEKPVLWDDTQGLHTAKSQVLAKCVHRMLLSKLSPVDHGVREAPLLVLRGADMPAVLVEMAHLSHPAEEAELRKPEVIDATAEAICKAIKEYFSQYP